MFCGFRFLWINFFFLTSVQKRVVFCGNNYLFLTLSHQHVKTFIVFGVLKKWIKSVWLKKKLGTFESNWSGTTPTYQKITFDKYFFKKDCENCVFPVHTHHNSHFLFEHLLVTTSQSLHSTSSVYHTIHSWLTFCFFLVCKKYRNKYSHRNWKLRYLLPRIYHLKCLRVFLREFKWETKKKYGKRKMKKRKKIGSERQIFFFQILPTDSQQKLFYPCAQTLLWNKKMYDVPRITLGCLLLFLGWDNVFCNYLVDSEYGFFFQNKSKNNHIFSKVFHV